MDARRLLLFRDIARAGSLSAAARGLGWTQPAVSQQLGRLEREVGAPLLIRSSRGVTPTDLGRVLLARADAIAGELHMAREEAAAATALHRGRVRLMAFPTAAAALVPRALRRLRDDAPGLTVTMSEAEPPEATDAVLRGDADLALVFSYDDARPGPGLVWRPIATESMSLVLPPDRPTDTTLADLAEETWVGGCPRCRQHLVAVCERAGFVPRLEHATDDYVAVQSLVAAGLGVSALPAAALSAYRHPEIVAVESAELGQRHVGAIHRPGADGVPATRALLERLASVPGHHS